MSRNLFYYTGLERVMRAITLANGLTNLTTSNCVISKPAPISGSWKENTTTKNTVVKISQTIPAVTYNGKNWVTYDRVPIASMLNLLPNAATLKVDYPTNVYALLRAINRRWGIGLGEADVINDPITLDGDGKGTVTMMIHPDSYLYTGSFTFNIIPGDANLDENVTVTTLSGMNYPDGSTTALAGSKGYAQPYSYSFDFTLKEAELRTLKVGTDLGTLADILTYITKTTWTNGASDADNAYTLLGSEILYNGLNSSSYPTSSAFKYLVIVKMGPRCKLQGNMYLQFNDKDDPNSPN
ncbi:hypothetical protein pEaSNUABM38_00140 [Erwinia phage pEa_SNUABM_38]|nr:hypothetical protein pEaSNUABM38_00140 [Erwinia phage pEa_SNUABM_38]